jgi:hypothetical protein
MLPSTYTAFAGDSVKLTGQGFSTSSAGNAVIMNGDTVAQGVTSMDGGSLSFTIPNKKPGKYEVKVHNGRVLSVDNTVIWIRTPGATAPTITKITPTTVEQGDTVTITGTGFLPTGNEIVTTFGIMSNLTSSDGTHISFPYNPFTPKVVFRKPNGERQYSTTTSPDGKPLPFQYKIGVTLLNANGMTDRRDKKSFILEM